MCCRSSASSATSDTTCGSWAGAHHDEKVEAHEEPDFSCHSCGRGIADGESVYMLMGLSYCSMTCRATVDVDADQDDDNHGLYVEPRLLRSPRRCYSEIKSVQPRAVQRTVSLQVPCRAQPLRRCARAILKGLSRRSTMLVLAHVASGGIPAKGTRLRKLLLVMFAILAAQI